MHRLNGRSVLGRMKRMVQAVVLAGGRSSRMGRCKAALPLAGPADTFLTRIVSTCLAAGLTQVVVVTGAEPEEVVRALPHPDPRVRFVWNGEWQKGQLSSLVTGLDAAGPDVDAAVVALVDAPLFASATVSMLLDRWRETGAPIVRPTFHGSTVPRFHGSTVPQFRDSRVPGVQGSRGPLIKDGAHGHPVLFDRSVFDELRTADRAVGAKAVLRAHAHEILDVPIDDPGAFIDIDTPEEYTHWQRALRKP